MTSTCRFKVATANTQHGQALLAPAGLAPLDNADVLLLQEVSYPHKEVLERSLAHIGFRLIHECNRFGLVIALRHRSCIEFLPGSNREYLLADMSKIERTVMQRAAPDHLKTWTQRGLISSTFTSSSHHMITIATTHPTTPVGLKPRGRNKQIIKLASILKSYYNMPNLIIGGDMNHYPGPKRSMRNYGKTMGFTVFP